MPDRSIDTGRDASTGRDTYTEAAVVRDTSLPTQTSGEGRNIIDRYLERSTETAREVAGNARDVAGRGIERFIDNARSLFGNTRRASDRTLEYVDTVTTDNPVEEPEEPSAIDTVRSYLDQLGERQRDYPIAVIEGTGSESSGFSPVMIFGVLIILGVGAYFLTRKAG
jgi:hypothetical protein